MIAQQQQRFTHDDFFGPEVIKNEGEYVTEHGNQVSFTNLLPFSTATGAVFQIHMIDAHPAQIGDGGNQEMVLSINQFVPGNELGRQFSGRQPIGSAFGQITDQGLHITRFRNQTLNGHSYPENTKKEYSNVSAWSDLSRKSEIL
ncbi:MAG: hypothetical protein JNJ95_06250 [Dechloromonas sp.]|nr:hypothetical protein [Dechloromonas sp.]